MKSISLLFSFYLLFNLIIIVHEKKTRSLFVVTLVASVSLSLIGCNKDVSFSETNDESPIVGTCDFISFFSPSSLVFTKGGELTEEEARAFLSPLFEPSIEYLSSNGYDYHEDLEEGDPTIVLAALCLADFDQIINRPTTKSLTAGEIVGCILIGEEMDDLLAKGIGKIAKKVTKKALQRCLPYVGVAIAVASGGACLYDAWND